MNLNTLFNNRNKNFARLSEAGDYLGRRLRENLVIYEIDDNQNTVTYVTESNNFITCNYNDTKGKLTFDNFVVENLEKITSDEAIDAQVNTKVNTFMEALATDRYDTAEASFDSVLESFTMRARIEESRKKLSKRISLFGENYNITSTKAYKKFRESAPLLINFLKENAEVLQKDRKLIEGLRLSKVVGETYDLPKLTLESINDEFIVIPRNSKKTLYEMVCEKELVRKELLEAKESFGNMWAKNSRISNLASHIYATDDTIKASLREAVAEVPYMALSNKVDLVSVMDSVFQVTNPGNISQKDIKEFVDKIYEFKKPLKTMVLETLNNVYGVNIQSLRFIPSFKGLAEVQSQVFTMMSEHSEEGILADVLKEFAGSMNRKGGVQVLDVANHLSEIMEEANFTVVDIDENFHMKKLCDYLAHNIDETQYYGDDDPMSTSGGNATTNKKKKSKKDKDWGGNKGDIKAKDRKKDDDSKLTADEKGEVDYNKNDLPGDKLTKKQSDKMDKDKDGDIDAKDLKKLRKEGMNEDLGSGRVGQAGDEPEGAEEEMPEEEQDMQAAEDQQAEADREAQTADFEELVGKVESITDDIEVDLPEDEEESLEAEESEEKEEETKE
tara:strand:+ start:57 stop:1901 length:1845 start_codon:yes stop_codon:yes gene_type:complete